MKRRKKTMQKETGKENRKENSKFSPGNYLKDSEKELLLSLKTRLLEKSLQS